MVLTPALIRVSGPSENGKKASLVAMARRIRPTVSPPFQSRCDTKSGGPFVPLRNKPRASPTATALDERCLTMVHRCVAAVRVAGSGLGPAACSQAVASVVRLSSSCTSGCREWS